MHTDARTLDDGTLIEGDLCIVGAGAAGITMALEWVGASHSVVLLEGGGFSVEAQMQDLYAGEIVGQPYFPLNAARLHAFGGTTGHWAGFCAPLDPIDFTARDWVPMSGWPFGRDELDRFYERAQRLVELGPYEYEAAYWTERYPSRPELSLGEDVVRTKMWQFSPPTRFGRAYRDEIVEADNVHLYTYANATEVQANEPVQAVEGLRVQTPNGKTHRVRAQRYVLACGAMQNARLLLASNRQMTAGLGNHHDLVGRYFMEHIEMPGAQLILSEPQPLEFYMANFRSTEARGELTLTAAAQRTHRILNGTASLSPGVYNEIKGTFQQLTPEFIKRSWNRSGQNDRGFPELSPDAARDEQPAQPVLSRARAVKLFTRQEQAPNPASRVTLSDETDALGMPRVVLDWQLTALDKRSMRTFYEVLGRQMGQHGIGRVQILEWLQEDDDTWPDFVSGGWHHMGTARMHDDPTRGVVDANSKVHGLRNLYVAGSAVYPTSGAANPTLTLIALTLRLSDYLKTRFK